MQLNAIQNSTCSCSTEPTCSSYSLEPIPKPSACQSPCGSLTDLHILENENNATRRTSTPLSLEDTEEEDGEEVFTFSSCLQSAKRGQPFSEAFESLSSNLKSDDLGWEGERKETCLEDDFIGSEGEEVHAHMHAHTVFTINDKLQETLK